MSRADGARSAVEIRKVSISDSLMPFFFGMSPSPDKDH